MILEIILGIGREKIYSFESSCTMPYSPVEYGPAVLCHIIFLLSSFEFLPLASEIIFALKGILFLVSAVFIWLFFTQYKSYTNYKDESVIHLWNPSPLSSFFL